MKEQVLNVPVGFFRSRGCSAVATRLQARCRSRFDCFHLRLDEQYHRGFYIRLIDKDSVRPLKGICSNCGGLWVKCEGDGCW
jgi:hypothetical protein